MQALVSDILDARKQEPDGLARTALLSLGAHAAVFGLLALVPTLIPVPQEQPRVVMNISLGGSPGPRTGGMQMIGGRRIDAAPQATDPQIARPTALPSPPPAPKMALPDPRQKPRTPPRTTAASKDPKGTVRGRGFETQEGTTRVDTGARGQGFGLSSGGGGGGNSSLSVGDFCCPEYLADMLNRISRNWNQNQRATGVVYVRYTIQRSGQITDISVSSSSGNPVLDLASQRALVITRALPPLPAAFTQPSLTVNLEFRYERN